MARLRLNREQIQTEAKRLAEEFVRRSPGFEGYIFRHVGTHRAPTSPSSKHPVIWTALFTRDFGPGVVVDGGELLIVVNVETKDVHLSPLHGG